MSCLGMIRHTGRFHFLLAIIAVALIGGCNQDKGIVPDTPQMTPPVVNITITTASEQIGPGSRIEINVVASAGSSNIAKMKYAISGAVVIEDSVVYSPPPEAIEEVFSFEIPPDAPVESNIILNILVYDIRNDSSRYAHEISPTDTIPPSLALSHDSTTAYAPGDYVKVGLAAEDNNGLYYITYHTSGAYESRDTLFFAPPYPQKIDTQIVFLLPDTTYYDISFSFEVTAYDAGLNSAADTLPHEIMLTENIPPKISIRLESDTLVQKGDSLRFWIIGKARVPLKQISYYIWRGLPSRGDSLYCEYFAPIDSAYFAIYVPDSTFCYNGNAYYITCTDAFGNYGRLGGHFYSTDRVQVNLRTEIPVEGIITDLVVDDVRDVIYLVNTEMERIDKYSMTHKSIVDAIPVGYEPSLADLTADGKRLVISNRLDPALKIIDLARFPPQVVSTIDLSHLGSPEYTELWQLAVTANDQAMVFINYNVYVVDLISGEVSTVEWLTADDRHWCLAVSGNRQYLGIGSSAGWLKLYDVFSGEIKTTYPGWEVHQVAINHDGSLIWACPYSWDEHNGFFDANLNFVASFDLPMCFIDVYLPIFSNNSNDLFHIGDTQDPSIGIIDGDDLYIEERNKGAMNQGLYFTNLALNANDDRIFIAVRAWVGYYVFSLWDIPVRRD